jgi:hypothetical protein
VLEAEIAEVRALNDKMQKLAWAIDVVDEEGLAPAKEKAAVASGPKFKEKTPPEGPLSHTARRMSGT